MILIAEHIACKIIIIGDHSIHVKHVQTTVRRIDQKLYCQADGDRGEFKRRQREAKSEQSVADEKRPAAEGGRRRIYS